MTGDVERAEAARVVVLPFADCEEPLSGRAAFDFIAEAVEREVGLGDSAAGEQDILRLESLRFQPIVQGDFGERPEIASVVSASAFPMLADGAARCFPFWRPVAVTQARSRCSGVVVRKEADGKSRRSSARPSRLFLLSQSATAKPPATRFNLAGGALRRRQVPAAYWQR